jgi:hypothetical protein
VLLFYISDIVYEMDFGTQQCVDLLLNGLKVAEGISFPERNFLHNININEGCIIVNVTKSLNASLPLPYRSEGADTLSEAVGGYIQWPVSEIVNQIGSGLRENEVVMPLKGIKNFKLIKYLFYLFIFEMYKSVNTSSIYIM